MEKLNQEPQFNLPETISRGEIKILVADLQKHIDAEISLESEDVIKVYANGVASFFKVNMTDTSITLDSDKSYDIFAIEPGSQETDQKPVQSAEKIHKERKIVIEKLLNEIRDDDVTEQEAA